MAILKKNEYFILIYHRLKKALFCITLHITVQWQAITNTDNNEHNNNNNNVLCQEKTSEQSYTNWIINQSLRGQVIKEGHTEK